MTLNDVIDGSDLTAIQKLEFREFCEGATDAVGFVAAMIDENGDVFVRDGEPFEMVDQLPEWQDNEHGIQDVVADKSAEEWMGFFTSQYETLSETQGNYGWSGHGHDYVLTAGHHGAGFWDRGYGVAGDRLTEAAHGGTGSHSFWFAGDALKYEAM